MAKWQTRSTQNALSKDVWVQVPLSAHKNQDGPAGPSFFISYELDRQCGERAVSWLILEHRAEFQQRQLIRRHP